MSQPAQPQLKLSPAETDKLRHLQRSNRILVDLNEEWAATNQGLRARIAVLEKVIMKTKAAERPSFLDQALNEGDGTYKP